ncbi:TetR family transcriptional regulator [Mycobacterium intermedium]|uniref:TetR family transcriptional regulator n=1 Tax=Mycobacterium intermedium TaxID=28445 RepID=A0A1E3S699_MYCIE|nr:TetR/AcrR family transcriptional regulator [Mycobacterium intermedium]MCV6967929.1 TetR/AcrR family transcriptional regulator [Mycobacterium intermedium]ODQ97705.1 TetR family transcriptional regulator [Mycobacterium intermedium]OPE49591.1 TetR family transcriptional regulator [Mycobacterium intermedium]ORB09446.1 TetR family transcriptional regulator [Mycobacterium intermedium]
MAAKKGAGGDPEASLEIVDSEVVEPTSTWQERTIERRLSSARARALARSSRFLATALELVEESGKADFTIQTLIDRSNLSLRAFYQHFAGKEELLLALYENVTSQFTENIRQEVAAADGPMEQLEAFCRGVLYRAESSESVGGRVMTIYNLSLEIERPADFAKVWEPHLKLLTKILTDCARAGLVRTDLTPAQLTTLLNTTLTALAQIGVFHLGGKGSKLTEDQLWAWCKQAISPPADQPKPKAAKKTTSRTSSTRRVRKLTG